ncbi:hypothetical protein GLOTRDRAFT_92073 [Gloeophyllum trabeum ATCC 11539]|uniref:Uncharacterized protein n=1 Tax=Gloeophyllum trabeum (strain ATCC 11539 / FP-39264 / Madison 617) TaxID=670483 RepID=S7RUH7_GLOTA|nr:uncharacterized protein GLOTRDRAFT_92073 [Gloeophyllum trabeum ATCC 11539]EPQ56854.1 hypothetical protein GLOTRDRAFT_92073 [Gloeophyllum trabeum ATCC 11539]
MPNKPVHVYIPFDGVADKVKRGIIDKINEPNKEFDFAEPPIAAAPALDASELPEGDAIPNHAEIKLEEAIQKELQYGQECGRGTAFFIWAEGSALQASDPTVQVIHVWPPEKEGDKPKVQEIRAELGQVAGIVNCVESGNQSFEECQEWAGPDGVVRA